MKKVLVLIVTALLMSACGTKEVSNKSDLSESLDTTTPTTIDEPAEIAIEKMQVSSSIIPLSSVINAVGGEYVEVENIVPAWVSPHGFDLSAKQMASISKSRIVFLTWLEHIDWFLEKSTDAEKQVHLADWMELLEAPAHAHDDHGDEHKDDDHHEEENHKDEHDEDDHDDKHWDEHGDVHDKDPHVWLGKDNIIEIAKKVRDELSTQAPEHNEYFDKNTLAFISEIEVVYSDFSNKIDGKIPAEFIVFHDAYNYFMQSVGMDMNLKVPFSENVLHDVWTAHMAELIEEIELHGIKHAFTEPQFSGWVLEKLANDYDLKVWTLDPIGTDPSASGYIENLRSNLENISIIYE